LSQDDGLKLLRTLAPQVVEGRVVACRELVEKVEGLPLALQVAGRMLRAEQQRGRDVDRLLEELRADKAKLLNAPAPADVASDVSPTVALVLQKSTDCLESTIRRRFAYLGPFAPRPATFNVEDLMAVWRVDESEAQETIDVLIDRGLLEPLGNGDYTIHQILVEHAKMLLKQ
jgi:NADH/NAD ratio-sensing transcriptional regulator Rex